MRVIAWMQTAHATLRDRYSAYSTAVTLVVMGLSIIGLVLGAANGEDHVRRFGLDTKLQYVLAALAAMIFFITVVELIVDWQRRRFDHAYAAKRLGELSGLYRRAVLTNGSYSAPGADLAAEYDRVMASLVPIPDSKAAALKARHNRKKEVFRRADRHPGTPAWLLRLQVLWDALLLKTGREEQDADEGQGTQ
jgi:hypothetical protein